MVIFNKKWKKYNEIQLTKNIMDLNIRKMTNHPPSPEINLRWWKSTLLGLLLHFLCYLLSNDCMNLPCNDSELI